jgi:hypothetical protein
MSRTAAGEFGNPNWFLPGVSRAAASSPMQPLDAQGTQLPYGNEDIRYLSRRPGNAQTSVFDTRAPAVPLPRSDELAPDDRREFLASRFENRVPSSPVGAAPGLNQPATQREATRPLGLVSGEPMPDWSVPPPIWGFPNSRPSRDEDRQDWIARLLRSVGRL